MPAQGQIIILNGAPRSGKSSIVRAIQDGFDGVWVNLGVDAQNASLPKRLRPGIGLRPGGERPELEPVVQALFAALYASMAEHSRLGLNVVVDVGHHDAYSQPLNILRDCARLLTGLPSLFVGARCPIEVIMQRRADAGQRGQYLAALPDGTIPEPVLLWQREVHRPGVYDLEVDTSLISPEQCVGKIKERLMQGPAASQALALLAG